jgi:cytochrome P450
VLRDFDAAIVPLVMGVFPSITAPDGYKGRAAIQAALIKYFKAGHGSEPDVSKLIRARYGMHRSFGFQLDDFAKTEVSMPWAATTNSIPTLYWMLVSIFSNQNFLEKIRNEITTTIVRSDEGGIQNLSIEISKLHSDCPLLVSIYKEAMRLMNQQVSIRFVQADTIICAGGESYTLKKGAAVQLPAGLMHKSSAFWGDDALVFDGTRFLKATSRTTDYDKESKGREKAGRIAYMPFGGGRNLCPGRHFAFAGVLGTAAAIVLSFDFISRDGQPIIATYERSRRFGEGTARPIKEMDVRIVRRKDMQHATLGFITQ